MHKWTRTTGSLRRLLIWAILLGTWEGAFRVVQWKTYNFPAPSTLAASLGELADVSAAFGTRPLVHGSLISLWRLAQGFAISIALGGLVGLLMWRWAALDDLLGPVFLGMQTLPSVCWAPLGILFFGLDEKGILFVTVMGSFFAIALSLRDGLRTIPPIYPRAGLMLGARSWRLYAYVLLPASLPALAGSLRQGFSFAWRSLMGGELMFLSARLHGLGFWLNAGRELGTRGGANEVVAVMLVMVVIGMCVDRWVFSPLQSRVQARFGLA
jgi:NitT/TauT family transport system permease protein